jgi:hypothetical protein
VAVRSGDSRSIIDNDGSPNMGAADIECENWPR